MVVTATFESGDEARAAIQTLVDAGYAPDQVSAVIPEPREVVKGHRSLAGALRDPLVGGVAGAVVGTVATRLLGPAILPGVGAAVVAGSFVPITTMIGTVVGALVELGHEPESAHGLYRELEEGSSIVTVQGDGDVDGASELLWSAGATHVAIS
jgi:hypothetical protein